MDPADLTWDDGLTVTSMVGLVAWAVENEITTGTTTTTFTPGQSATRAQFVTFLYRAET